MKKLTVMQRKFAHEYIKNGNATEAAKLAGYSPSTARFIGAENLTKPNVRAYIDERMDKMASKSVMDAKEAVELLTDIARGKKTETVLTPTAKGTVVKSQKEADLKTRIVAVKELLKRYPSSDEVVKQQLRKLTAEADLAEAKAQIVNGANVKSDDDGFMSALKTSGEKVWTDD